MEGIGRGRARGKRIIDVRILQQPPPMNKRDFGVQISPNPPQTKSFGRGFFVETLDYRPLTTLAGRGAGLHLASEQEIPNLSSVGRGLSKLLDAEPYSVGQGPHLHTNNASINSEDAKRNLDRELSSFENKGEGCLIRITLDYFSSETDVEFYMNKVLNSAMKLSMMAEKLAMTLRLLTCHRTYGQEIKAKIFSFLQLQYQNMPPFGEISQLHQLGRQRMINLCFLIGQIYFRFRPMLGSSDRYHVLANPTAHCMLFLLHIRGIVQLRTLVLLINMNYKSLCEQAPQKMDELCLEIHKALASGVECPEERLWLLCAVDHIAGSTQTNKHGVSHYYQEQLGTMIWEKVAVKFPVQLLADIPSDLSATDLEQFNVNHSDYDLHKFAEQ